MSVPDDTVRILALGSSATWTVDLTGAEESVEPALEIEGPNLYLELQLASTGVLREMSDFLRAKRGATEFSELRVGTFCGVPVSLRKDDEHRDHFFIAIHAKNTLLATLGAEDVEQLNAALAQIIEELPA